MTKLQINPILNLKYNLAEEKEFKKTNIFEHKPDGFVIIDSYNNPIFPTTVVDLDNSKFSYPAIKQELKRKNWFGYFTPWHYWVEFVELDYIAIQGRPINYKNVLPGFENHIVICIAGNSKNDIYMSSLYKCLADIIISSIHYIPSWKLDPLHHITLINIGKSFDENQLLKLLR
jgi:hypothetical protein